MAIFRPKKKVDPKSTGVATTNASATPPFAGQGPQVQLVSPSTNPPLVGGGATTSHSAYTHFSESHAHKVRTVIPARIRYSGKLYFDCSVKIDGQMEGEIFSTSTVHVSGSGIFSGEALVRSLVVDGQLAGEVKAMQRIEIRPGGALLGRVVTPSLIVSEGGIFEGECKIINESDASDELSDVDSASTDMPSRAVGNGW